MSEINLEEMVSELQSDFTLLTSAIENGTPIDDDLLGKLKTEEAILLGMALSNMVIGFKVIHDDDDEYKEDTKEGEE